MHGYVLNIRGRARKVEDYGMNGLWISHGRYGGLIDYKDFADYFSVCRTPKKGRPFRNWGRLFREEDDYVIHIMTGRNSSKPIARVSPDNVLTFCADPSTIREYAPTLVGHSYKAFPIAFYRHSMGVYRVAHLEDMWSRADNSSPWPARTVWEYLRVAAPFYHSEIKFDLTTGKCLNSKERDLKVVDPDKRKIWLKDLKAFKRGIYTRVKLGAMEALANKTWEKVRSGEINHSTQWTDSEVEFLADCMKAKEFPVELLTKFTFSSNGWIWGSMVPVPTNEKMTKYIDSTLKSLSVRLRTHYDVFDTTGDNHESTAA